MPPCPRCLVEEKDRFDSAYCRHCRAQIAKERRHADPDRHKAYVTEWRRRKRDEEQSLRAVKHFEAADGGFSCPVRKCRLCAQELYTGKKL